MAATSIPAVADRPAGNPIDGLQKSYKRARPTPLSDINLEIAVGEFVSLIGRSGCGKTTLLRIMAGLVEPTAGQILIGGRASGTTEQSIRSCFAARRRLPGRQPVPLVQHRGEHRAAVEAARRQERRDRQARARELADWWDWTVPAQLSA